MPAFPGIPNSYWVIEHRFAAGEYPGAHSQWQAIEKLAHLLDRGIDFFVDLTQTDDPLEPYSGLLAEEAERRGRVFFDFTDELGSSATDAFRHDGGVVYVRTPIRDMNVPSRAEMVAILNLIDTALEAGRRVYVHCWGGVGRTGTVVGCHLVRQGSSGADALARVAALFAELPKAARFRRSPQTNAQCSFVRDWLESREPDARNPVG